jgi:hypothetical protein
MQNYAGYAADTGSAAGDAWRGIGFILSDLVSHASFATHILGNRTQFSCSAIKLLQRADFGV